jgi:hypothetical protein
MALLNSWLKQNNINLKNKHNFIETGSNFLLPR